MRSFLVKKKNTLKEALKSINSNGNKCVVVVDEKNKLLGTLSDGDIRKAIIKKVNINSSIEKYFNKKSYFINKKNTKNRHHIQNLFLKKHIDLIPEVDDQGVVKKIITWSNFFGKEKKFKIKKTPVIIMAGGQGKRLKPFTNILPKPLIPIKHKPVIEYILDKFTSNGYDNFYITINYKSQIIRSYFNDIKKYKRIKFYDEKIPRGTVGCLSDMNLPNCKNFFITNCDIILDIDYADLMKFHTKNKNHLTLVASAKEFKIPYGVCQLNDNGSLEKIKEKPSYDFLVNAGLYLLNYDIKKMIPKNKFFDLTDLLNILIKKKYKIGVYPVNDTQWIDIGQWSEFKKALENL
ncbi:MAG: nucleotidyltransferase [Candidatus Pelagibacter sp.]|nr:nucleotidyltransferase [Candidatus Pelagibacter sp.]OUV88671.1 MAG: hypothetical protein CBC96_00180 [Pelagibacteraceae bacterium TMED136]|tara:strand:+ start:19595 stop:20641 length:1047 start_codon:yes stop_codon:yes gene_type:complete